MTSGRMGERGRVHEGRRESKISGVGDGSRIARRIVAGSHAVHSRCGVHLVLCAWVKKAGSLVSHHLLREQLPQDA
jgi:hypothetical protein